MLRRMRMPVIAPREAAERAARGQLQLVDVREPQEVAQARVPDAVHIPLTRLGAQIGRLDRDRPIAFLCRSGNRSAAATRAALDSGFDAANVRGGIVAWVREGLPVARSSEGATA